MCNWCIWGRLGSALLAVLLLSLPACGGMTGLVVFRYPVLKHGAITAQTGI